ncbi:MAG: ABC transporter permease [Firmicutes bacterium]|nr:ABC transporter permease [Bacillota bacterium]
MIKYIKGFLRYRFLLGELVKKGIKLKYRRSYLGIVWSLIEPILTTIVLVAVFGTLFNNTEKTYPLYIICGRLIYSFFSAGTKAASSSIRRNASMIQKVYVPKYLYPLADVLFNYLIFFISLAVLILIMIYSRTAPTLLIWQVIPALIFLLLLTTGVGLFLCTLTVYFRDMEYLWNVSLMLIMYMSAIFYYPERIMNSGVSWLLKYNPLFCVIDMFRGGVMGYQASMWDFGYCGVSCVAVLVVGTYIFWKKQDDFLLHL